MNTFEQSFAAEFEKIALSKTNIINAPTGKPRTFKSELGDLLTMGVGGGLGALAGGAAGNVLGIPEIGSEEGQILGGALGAGLGLMPRYFK
ncbi:MAG: hypothetical protein EBU84_04520, partial [Actinobacteria bacterium]|nr:hypothetical protein [Actinomycetota bacterium]